jgi:hypothetical protein
VTTALESATREIENLRTELTQIRARPSVIAPPPSQPAPERIEFDREFEPLVTTQKFGNYESKSYTFKTLYGSDGRVLAVDAKFRNLSGLNASFGTREGLKTFQIDELHPSVLAHMGYDADLLKRQTYAQAQRDAADGLARRKQAEWAQTMRNKAAIEMAATAQAERDRAEANAAVRNAQANETLANVARLNLLNPAPPPQVNVSVSQAQAQGQ